ncbi:aspartate aminotransferase family protein [Niveispirillum lacus]|uniref:Aspartate aminotransferase family protein n=1 Tax=Niveispirillum lacus TaxID=1981099 RepID=A0A255YQS0_9PROT|nr:aspartate aminotransferase family protein [Niveispirillum lacus]OYQ31531.1 aspartate aminotransferase family protein [Niveispirillum lacus]
MGDGSGGISTATIHALMVAERTRYAATHPDAAARVGTGVPGFYQGVPMHWMRDWPMPFPFLVANAQGATLTDTDGHVLADFCLGDTGSMFGHSPEPVRDAIIAQAGRGLTYMLPTDDAIAVGRLLTERFGLPHWQVATTATDANRFALRVARAVTGRGKILVFNGCYHGTVDETFVRLIDGATVHRPGLLGQYTDLTAQTRVVEFNDIPALEAALSDGQVACVITEPVLTNCCMVLPDPGFHAALRRLTRQSGTLLLIDETHTISTGPGGYTTAYGLEPDMFVLGKPVAGGVPASIWGFSDDVALRLDSVRARTPAGHSGMGTTLSANALALACMRATLEQVMAPEAYAHMERLSARLEAGLSQVITSIGLPWHVVRVGARVEFICAPGPLRNGTQAEAAHAGPLEQAIHLALLNRGILIAPFHNMMLVCPLTTQAQVDALIAAFADVAGILAQGKLGAP